MYLSIPITRLDSAGDGWSLFWAGGVCTVSHSLGAVYSAVLLDAGNNTLTGSLVINENETIIDFGEPLGALDSYTLNLLALPKSDGDGSGGGGFDPGEEEEETTEHYSGKAENILLFCRSLNISEDRLATVPLPALTRMQRIVDDAIDGYLCEYYFTPIVAYNQVRPDGTVRKVFPGKIRFLAIQWTAGLLLMSEFQGLEPNVNEHAQRFVEEAKKEMQQMVDYSTRIPGQRRKHPSPTMPPNLAPSKTNEFQL